MEYAIRIISAFVWNVHLKRALHSIEATPSLNFWRVIYGNCLDIAVIEWCKLFGSDHEDHQPAHWKNVVPEERHDEFRAGLFSTVGVTQDEWAAYWRRIKGYRDNHAAHFNEEYLRPENNPTYPDFDLALKAAYFYYEWILRTMQEDGRRHSYPDDIRDYCQRFFEQATEVATHAIGATSHMQETVR